ncbi:uncharacterized protein OCT59_021075 [Rhizophagus irregularis]|uniref:uncharacterized protein n=1 Tax=Rhizophagus irregularis TaxID=588596 RepID=UPI00331C7C22|nr:hypothetical protein OCT59_021075 [Rhizophagus irregularis]
MVKFRIFSTAVKRPLCFRGKFKKIHKLERLKIQKQQSQKDAFQKNELKANEEEKKNNPQGKEDDNSIDTPTSSSVRPILSL